MSENIFTLSEANKLVPRIVELTAKTVQRLDGIRQRYIIDTGAAEPIVPEVALKEIEQVLTEWSEKVLEWDVVPKGYFTVDFQSTDPELLFCWTYGEDKISYTHKAWENFSHRRPLVVSVDSSTDHLKWVN